LSESFAAEAPFIETTSSSSRELGRDAGNLVGTEVALIERLDLPFTLRS